MIVFSPWGAAPILSRVGGYLAKIGVSLLLLVATLLVRRRKRFEKYWQILYALFISLEDERSLLDVVLRRHVTQYLVCRPATQSAESAD